MVTAAFIPVRAGSKSIPHKNIRLLAGRPLVHWVATAALECERIDQVYVASDGEEIRRVAAKLRHPKLTVVDRSPETATDEASTESALLEFARAHPEVDRLVLIQATSPLLTVDDLRRGLTVHDTEGVDSVLSVVRRHAFRWIEEAHGVVSPSNYDPRRRPRRQDWEGELIENGAFYITTREALLRSECRVSGRIRAVEMSPLASLEIDEPIDWTIADHIITNVGIDDLRKDLRATSRSGSVADKKDQA